MCLYTPTPAPFYLAPRSRKQYSDSPRPGALTENFECHWRFIRRSIHLFLSRVSLRFSIHPTLSMYLPTYIYTKGEYTEQERERERENPILPAARYRLPNNLTDCSARLPMAFPLSLGFKNQNKRDRSLSLFPLENPLKTTPRSSTFSSIFFIFFSSTVPLPFLLCSRRRLFASFNPLFSLR